MAALQNLLDINTIPADFETYNATGLLSPDAPFLIRAGGDYNTPWTRDASINSWCAGSLLEPEVARNTLLAVCQKDESGRYIIQLDNQSWDKIVWATGAYDYWITTGDDAFLPVAYQIISTALETLEETRYNSDFGLFTGGSFFNDGIAGYPLNLHAAGNNSSFVGDHPAVKEIMSLSTNCLYYHAYQVAAEMAQALDDSASAAHWEQKRTWLKAAVHLQLWDKETGTFYYFRYPNGTAARYQEACGSIFALLFGLVNEPENLQLLHRLKTSPRGILSIVPAFPGLFSEEQPGRHNNLIWPFINGLYIMAAAENGQEDLVTAALRSLTKLVENTQGEFYEIYHAKTGLPDGGWQCGQHWASCHHQTWSASAYLGAIYKGIFGLHPCQKGLSFRPCIPNRMADAQLDGLTIRGMQLHLTIQGSGSILKGIRVNGTLLPRGTSLLPWQEPGVYHIELRMKKAL